MKKIQVLMILCFSLVGMEKSTATQVDPRVQEKLALIDHFANAPIDPKYKIGMDALKKMVTEVYSQILPDVPDDDPNFPNALFDKYKNKKLPILTDYVNRDITRFRSGVWKAYEKSPKDRQEILEKINQFDEQYQGKQLSLYDYLIFTGELTKTAQINVEKDDCYDFYAQIFKSKYKNPLDKKNEPHKDLIEKRVPRGWMVPVPLHTGHNNFDGMFGEATISAAMLVGLMPLMYVTRQDVIADQLFEGPSACFQHDLGHFHSSMNLGIQNAYIHLLLPKIIMNSSLNDTFVESLFVKLHEAGLNSWKVQDQQALTEFGPMYMSYINFYIKIMSKILTDHQIIKSDRPKTFTLDDIRQLLSNPDILTVLKEGEPKGKLKIPEPNLLRILLALVLDVKNHPENLQHVNTKNKKFLDILNARDLGATITPENDPRKDFLPNGQTIQTIFGELGSIEFFEVLSLIIIHTPSDNNLKQAIFETIQEMHKAS